MWDTAGQEKFKTITSAYYKGSHGIIVVFDVCDRKSYEDVVNWLNEADKYSNPDAIRILVGNKSDMPDQRQVRKDQA
jgi:Ras-related protein Rab-1A